MDNEKAAASDWMGGAKDNVSGVAEERSCISAVADDANNNAAADHKVVPYNHEANIDDDNEINGAASHNTAPQPTTTATTTSATTPIFQYHRSSMMDALSKVANLSCTTTNTIEIARSFDESVASFIMMPHNNTAAADCSDQDGNGNDDDNEIDGVDKGIPSLQIVPTFTSSFDSIDDEETAALDYDNNNNNNNNKGRSTGDYEEKRYCWTRRRRIVCWIGIIILVIGCLLGIVMTVLFIQMKKHESTTGTAMMTLDSVFVNSSSQLDFSAAGVSMDIPSAGGNDQQESLMTAGLSTEMVSTITGPNMKPTEREPSTAPSNRPSSSSSLQPSTSIHPSISPSTHPSVTPSSSPFALFNYGERLITNYNLGIEISEGLAVRQIAKFGEQVEYVDGNKSNKNFHAWLDGAGVAPLPGGEWVYISNSEDDDGNGGVYGVYFNKYGEVINYKTLLSGTTWNCGGGMTPWNTWVSCEESNGGHCWQVDPNPDSPNHSSPKRTLLGGATGGNYESVAVDNRDVANPVFFMTEDNSRGELRRFVADGTGWDALHVGGKTTYLEFLGGNKFRWTSSLSAGMNSASTHYPNTEGIAYHNSTLFFVSKVLKRMFILNLDDMTYTSENTGSKFDGQGSFNAQPDQIKFHDKRKFIYFTEDGGSGPGVHARDNEGKYYTLFRGIPGGQYSGDETVGIAFSPDRLRFYAGYQDEGVLFEITREDGQVFN